MTERAQPSNGVLWTAEEMIDTSFPLIVPEDTLQLQADILNVEEDRISIDTFPPDYQERIKTYYRFSATFQTSESDNIAQRTKDTLDLI